MNYLDFVNCNCHTSQNWILYVPCFVLWAYVLLLKFFYNIGKLIDVLNHIMFRFTQ